ncbi:MAG: LD-carboxypeptidase [Clostridia bacterium]|nr:LD-carboxypeptidase [Clostridia bacterium]
MNYPESLKKGDLIGICAPSAGIVKPEKIEKLEIAIKALEEMGYRVIETKSVRCEENGRSASAKVRAEEFMSLLLNEEVKMIIFATGGDFLCEMLDYLDFDLIKTLKPKWMQGYSDITGISYLFNSIFDIPTLYAQTIKDYAMLPLHQSLIDALKIASGEEVVQYSFDKYEKEWADSENPRDGYNATEPVEWKNILGPEKIEMQGRTIGGCLDCIKSYIGTKYDKVTEYIKRHSEDGIIWFLEAFEMNTAELQRTLWQMKSAGYFENCNGIIFGRPLFIREDYETSFNDAVKKSLEELNIPVICDADIGHVSPQMSIVNGAVLKITSENGKGRVDTYLR